MPNRQLNAAEMTAVNALLSSFRQQIKDLAGKDSHLEFAIRRKIFKELSYDERGKPLARRKLKKLMWEKQGRRCAHCKEEMDVAYSELDRTEAAMGYVETNVRLIHAKCHHSDQAEKGYR